MSFEDVFHHSLRIYADLEHRFIDLVVLNKDEMDFSYGKTIAIPTMKQYQQCKDTPRDDRDYQECLYYAKDKSGLSFAIDKFATYKEVDYGKKEGYKQNLLFYKMARNITKPLFHASLPNLYSPVNGIIEEIIKGEADNNNNIFIQTLIIKDTLNYKHIFKYFYANAYPRINGEIPICKGRNIKIGDFLGFLAYDDSVANDDTYAEIGVNNDIFFKYIICDASNNFLNPITFWQWDRVEHYEVYSTQTHKLEAEIIYYFNKNNQMVELAYKQENDKYFERFFPNL